MAQRFDGLYHRDIGYSRQVPQRLKATSIATVNRRAEGPAPPKTNTRIICDGSTRNRTGFGWRSASSAAVQALKLTGFSR